MGLEREESDEEKETLDWDDEEQERPDQDREEKERPDRDCEERGGPRRDAGPDFWTVSSPRAWSLLWRTVEMEVGRPLLVPPGTV